MYQSRRKNAFMMIYAMFAMIVLMGMTSLAVDWGRVETAKTELQNATDAAARYAVTGLIDNTYATRATQAAANNKVDGSTLTLAAADVEVGSWSTTTKSFTINGSAHNAVRVWGRRTQARGTAIPLLFAKAIGRNTCDINTVSVATLDSLPYSMVALTGVTMSGTSTIQRKASEALTGGTVIVASNGAWSMGATSTIAGDQLYRGTAPTGGVVTGSRSAMSSDIAYAVQSAPGSLSNLGSLSYTSGSLANISGSYLCNACTLGGTFTLTLNGDLVLYCTGNVGFASNVNVVTNGYKFTIYMTGSGTISFTNNNALTGIVVYGPNCTMSVAAPGKITGSFVAKSLNMTSGTIEYSSSYAIPIAPSGGGAAVASGDITMVQ